ncbi:RecX family transcriptional regulator [Agromyces sp. ISL-38]|uniref:regulatory protein RecX n=1 Tax=Agromyces sp. ISL-38 TaxID=2819107 RepID=UPI001BE95D6B|nr:regulatory protein RecX [Agromyces sp. ISL-38]MBT2500460.1 RecX family transcriptional regulator [Agromyces sp. ISL-38]
MSDESSEHLAPVSYLPWATPAGETPRASPESRAEPEESRAEPEESPATEVLAERPKRREFGGQSRLSRRSRLAVVGDEVEATESGAERDERIDRLVVSRLRRSALSIAEVRSVLIEHGLDETEVEEWIERYERLGYLDDARLAEQVVHSHGARRGKGSGAIMQELGRRGVDPSAARAAVDELDPEVERENAHAVAERRARQLTGLDRKTAERRLSAFLQRRGYPGDVVREAVSSALAAAGS